MKKWICFAAAALVTMSLICPALAVEAVYNDGKVTVSTESSGFFEILVDGIFVGRWVGTGMPRNTFVMELEPGEHRVRIYCPDDGSSETNTFIVEGPEQEEEQPTEAPATEAPVADPTATPDPAAPATEAPDTAPTAAPAPEKKDTVEPAKAATTEKPMKLPLHPPPLLRL